MGMNSGNQVDFSWEISNGPWLVNLEGVLVGNCRWILARRLGEFFVRNLNGPQLGDLDGFLVGNCDGEALGRSYGVFVGRSEKGCCPVHQTGPGSGNVVVGCLMGLADGRMLRGAETKVVGSCAQRLPCLRMIYFVECRPYKLGSTISQCS